MKIVGVRLQVTAACLLGLMGLRCRCARVATHDTLTLELVDGATGRTVPGLVRVSDGSGKPVVLAELLARDTGFKQPSLAAGWGVLAGRASVRVPRARLRVEAFFGLETERAQADIDLGAGATLKIPLVRFYDARARGYSGGNTHLHLKSIPREIADRYLGELPRADGLDVVFLSYLERADDDRTYVSNSYTRASLEDLSARSGVLFGNGEEHRHNFNTGKGEGYGHVMLLDIRKLVLPVSVGAGIMKRGTDAPPLQKGIDEGRREGASVLWCHNDFGLEDIPAWVTGRVHAQNIFDGDDSKANLASHGSYQDTFYRYLNAGLKVPFSTGTDWFIYDFSRVYVPVEKLVTPRDWLRGLEAGKSFITNGPLFELTVDGQAPGGTVRLSSSRPVRVRGRVLGRVDFGTIELVRSAEIVATARSHAEGGHFTAAVDLDLDAPEPAWFALRIPPAAGEDYPRSEMGLALFGHTSPVYVEIGGQGVFRRAVAESLLADVRRAADKIRRTFVFANDHERTHVLGVYTEAARVLEGKIGP